MKNLPEPKSVNDIQVFLGFANFYQRFIQSFSKIVGPLTSMHQTANLTSSSIIFKLLIDTADEDKIGESDDNGTNLLNPSASKTSTRVGYSTSRGAKKGGNNPKRNGYNTKKDVKASKDSNY